MSGAVGRTARRLRGRELGGREIVIVLTFAVMISLGSHLVAPCHIGVGRRGKLPEPIFFPD
jgi:hypothetical protein